MACGCDVGLTRVSVPAILILALLWQLDAQQTTITGTTTEPFTTVTGPTSTQTSTPAVVTEEHTAPSYTTVAASTPVVDALVPRRGPLAGGTIITILGSGFAQRDAVIAVVMDISYQATLQHINDTYIEALTDAGDAADVNRKLRISLHMASGHVVSLAPHVTFTYRSNPNISDIYPLTTLLVGGTLLTVVGNSLDSVFRPTLELTTNVRRNLTASGVRETNSVTSEVCEHVGNGTGTSLLCPTPPSDIPDDIRAAAGNSSHGDGDSSVVTYDTDLAIVTLYIGFKFDGYKAYTNISNVTDEALAAKGILEIVVNPYFNVSLETAYAEGTPLNIPGYFVDAIDVSNYVVEVGEGVCQGVEISRRLLVCTPPSPGDQSAPSDRDVVHPIKVHPGRTLVYAVGHLTYKSNLILIIGLTVGGALLLAAIAVVAVLVVRRTKARRQRAREMRNYDPDALMDLGPLPRAAVGTGVPGRVLDTQPLPRPDSMLEAFEMATQPHGGGSEGGQLQTFSPDLGPIPEAQGMPTRFDALRSRLSDFGRRAKRPFSITRPNKGLDGDLDPSGGRQGGQQPAAVTRGFTRHPEGYIVPVKYRPGSIVDDFAETGRLKRRSHLYGGTAGVR